MVNPYQSPSDSSLSTGRSSAMQLRTQMALLAISIGFVVVYTSSQLHRIQSGRPMPIWPTLTIPFVLSIYSAVRSRLPLVPPLTVMFGIMSGSLVFAAFRSWAAAEFHIACVVALVLSLPSLFVAKWSRSRYVRIFIGPFLIGTLCSGTTAIADELTTETDLAARFTQQIRPTLVDVLRRLPRSRR